MRRFLAILLLLAPLRAHTQSLVTIVPNECVWHAGDNPAWADPSFNDSAWPSLDRTPPPHESLWIRCHADLSALRGLSHPAIMVTAAAAQQVFIGGHVIGALGNLRTGFFSGTTANPWPVPASLASSSSLVAIHLIRRSNFQWEIQQFQVGARESLIGLRDTRTLAAARATAPMALCFIIIGVIALTLFGFWLSDRSRIDLLLLSLIFVCLTVIRLATFAGSLSNSVPISLLWIRTPNDLAQELLVPLTVLFFFRLAGRRIPPVILFLTGLGMIFTLAIALADLASPRLALRTLAIVFGNPVFPAVVVLAAANEILAASLAFLPLRRLNPRVRAVGLICLAWVATDCVWYAIEAESRIPTLPHLFSRWYPFLAECHGFVLLAVAVALVALLLRDQRRVADERATLAGEMQAAREIQRVLIPSAFDIVPGLCIQAVFVPAREVGGDFYRCRILHDGAQRIVLGDVSGKGTAAAMTASLLLGALEGHDADSPSALLAHLSRALRASGAGGFATCLCVDINPSGRLRLANAGHLPPYHNGSEIEMPGSLPLGVFLEAEYAEISLALNPGDSLTFLVPTILPHIQGLRIEAAYVPAAEVGGDFYQVFPELGGSALIVVGDVSGKGLKAAMKGTLVLGAIRTLAQESLSPAQILERVNLLLAGSSDGGFVTCLCSRLDPDGTLTLANAGHLAPYRNGEEIPLDSVLPLGVAPDTACTESTVHLAPNDSLTFLSDGVVEAQSLSGELFGFDRTRSISTQPAEHIARAASTFGQQDDITVLTLTFAPAEVAHA